VNLWDLLTDLPVSEHSPQAVEERLAAGQRVKDLLNRSNRISGQEFSLYVSDQGWTIKVFSCFGESPLIEVYIPKDQHEAIQFTVEDGHKAAMYQRKWQPGKVWKRFYKFIGRTWVKTGRLDK
jgi:hypothetical protein